MYHLWNYLLSFIYPSFIIVIYYYLLFVNYYISIIICWLSIILFKKTQIINLRYLYCAVTFFMCLYHKLSLKLRFCDILWMVYDIGLKYDGVNFHKQKKHPVKVSASEDRSYNILVCKRSWPSFSFCVEQI